MEHFNAHLWLNVAVATGIILLGIAFLLRFKISKVSIPDTATRDAFKYLYNQIKTSVTLTDLAVCDFDINDFFLEYCKHNSAYALKCWKVLLKAYSEKSYRLNPRAAMAFVFILLFSISSCATKPGWQAHTGCKGRDMMVGTK